jgi:hypothetical protein
MIGRCTAILLALFLAFPASGFAQTFTSNPGGPTGFMAYGPFGGANPTPGGLTLVPGTVAIPGVSGAANTGTIPLPGTSGAPNVPVMNAPMNTGGLYPPASYPFVPAFGTSQSTLPQNGGVLNGPSTFGPDPSGALPNCIGLASACGR